jgi:hypothetical protein
MVEQAQVELPEGVFLLTEYADPRGGVRERWYHDDGGVWVVVDGERSPWCRFDADQVARAKEAVLRAGLRNLADVPASGPDQAVMTYTWRDEEGVGRLVDCAYPTVVPPAVDDLEEALMVLEEAAGPPAE